MSEHPDIKLLGQSGGVYWRRLRFKKAGDQHHGHLHRTHHVTFIHKGRVLCEVQGHEPIEAGAGQWLTIDKDTYHKFTALEDGTTYFCIFSLHDENGRRDPSITDAMLAAPPECATCPIKCESA